MASNIFIRWWPTIELSQPMRDFPGMKSKESAKTNLLADTAGEPIPIIPTHMHETENGAGSDLSEIRVVPNPLKGTSLLEEVFQSKIQFVNLPPACKISIFTLTGELVDTIYHDDGTTTATWELITRNRLRAVSGLYIYVVETELPDYQKFIGKFVIIR